MKKNLKKITAVMLSGILTASSGITSIYAKGDNNQHAPPQNEGGTPPEKPDGDNSQGPGNGQAPGGANTMTYDYSGTLSASKNAEGTEETSDGETIDSSTADQNSILAQKAGTLTVTKGTLTKSGDDTNGDNCNFYGINSIGLSAGSGSSIKISDSSLTSDSEGSNGLFATDSGTIYANNDTITTSKGNSRGLDATYSGTIIANQMNISTQGDHSASLATDRGGGSVSVTNSSLNTAGSGSPLIYSTGNIQVDNVTGTASGSQIAGMEGLNTILIAHSTLSSTQTDKTASDPEADGIIIYQSTSGDAENTTGEAAVFNASDSTLKSAITSGSMFYLTNTTANIVLSDTVLDFDSDKANLLLVEGNDSNNWGTAGSNGAVVKFTGLGETLSGNITADTISSADVYLLDETTWTGAASIEQNSVNTNPADSPLTVNVSSDSKWVVTGDSTVTNLNVQDGGQVVDSDGKTVTIIANGTMVAEGDSDITITVTGNYGTDFTTDDDNALSTDYIDRSDFDKTYNVSTTFNTNGSTVINDDTDTSAVKTETSHTSLYAGIGAAVIAVIVIGILLKKKQK
ncbi:MAG: hypothetical protein PUA69_07550 [Erysipelotrichaceae bacterium]|nr:hypothetical protein [Erysipelotrichaceae bacterium]